MLQAILDDMARVNTAVTIDHKYVADAYEALIAMVLLCCCSGLIILALTSLASIFQSRTVLNYSLMALPVSGLLVWCTAAVVYGMWVVAHDICYITEVYSTAAAGSELQLSAQNIAFPCPNTTAATELSYMSKKTHLVLSRAVNQLVTGET